MRFAFGLLLATAGLATAQTTACAAQNIVDLCLQTTKIPLDNCAPNDWQCMCDAQNAVVTCYNNCPNDPNKFAATQQQISWCNAAKQVSPTSSSASASVASATASALSSAASAASVTASRASVSAASASATASRATSAAAAFVAPVSGLTAVLFGVFGLMC